MFRFRSPLGLKSLSLSPAAVTSPKRLTELFVYAMLDVSAHPARLNLYVGEPVAPGMGLPMSSSLHIHPTHLILSVVS